ncbi:MAG: hypothetical protein EPN84_04385 [Legionella sp.]|nr:MAG: hypothetical protein EPN84_04385 [Legionella sp.]
MRLLRFTALICISLFSLTACGKKGPLYLPEPLKKHASAQHH